MFANYLGQVLGVLAVLPFVTGSLRIIGESGRAQAFLPATLLFLILGGPMLVWFRESKGLKIKLEIANEYRSLVSIFRDLWRIRAVKLLLIAFFFFNDAMLTVVSNFPIMISQIFSVSEIQKSLLVLEVLVTAGVGSLIGGLIADRLGNRRTLLLILLSWVVFFPMMSVVTDFQIFGGISLVMGLFYGATWTVSRVMMTNVTPPERLTEAFSYYTITERFATFIGPITWGIVTSTLINLGPNRYRVAVVSMTVLILIGFLAVRRIPKNS